MQTWDKLSGAAGHFWAGRVSCYCSTLWSFPTPAARVSGTSQAGDASPPGVVSEDDAEQNQQLVDIHVRKKETFVI